MNNLERLDLVNLIAQELQKRMTFRDIDAYLPSFGVDMTKPYSGSNSKWVYTKDRLADVSSDIILKIANELNIPHSFVVIPDRNIVESKYWRPGAFRLFLSHISSFKTNARNLQIALNRYGISSFVAHADIEPTKPWMDEIEVALMSMDALAAILVPGFKESNWTDQEIGFAMGRNVLIVPIMRGITPYGFISRFQGLNAEGKMVSQVAENIYRILINAHQTRSRMFSSLVDIVSTSQIETEVYNILNPIDTEESFPASNLERLKTGIASSPLFDSESQCLVKLNSILKKHNLPPIEIGKADGQSVYEDEDLPF